MADQLNLNATSPFKSPPKYSFTHSPVLGKDKPSKQPGPGEYPQVKAEKDKWKKTPSWSIGASTRGGKDWAPMPGPGAYTPSNPDFVSPKWGFTNDNRLKPNKRSTTPGPGQYELKSTLQGRDVSICSKPESKGLTGTLPGPGAFTPSWTTTSNYGSAPSIGFGASNRAKMVVSKTPGPGQYEIPTTLIGLLSALTEGGSGGAEAVRGGGRRQCHYEEPERVRCRFARWCGLQQWSAMDLQSIMAAMAARGLGGGRPVQQVPQMAQMMPAPSPQMAQALGLPQMMGQGAMMKGQMAPSKGMMPGGKMGAMGVKGAKGGNKGEMMSAVAAMMKGKGKGQGKSVTPVKGKGKVANKIAAGEPAFVGRVRTYNLEKSNGLISCPECWALCGQEVYVYKTVLESCGATVGDTVAFMVHWNTRGQPQASGAPEILRLYNAQGDMALKGTFKWGPGEQFGFIENAQVQEFFGRDTYVRKELADTLMENSTVAFNIKLNKEYQPCAAEAMLCDPTWEALPGDLSFSRDDPTVPPPWEALKQKNQTVKSTPTGEFFSAVIKAYNEKNGWGFLTSEELQARFGCDVFMHKNEMMNCPHKVAGTMVTFELGLTEDGKPQAHNVQGPGAGLAVEPPTKRQKLEDIMAQGALAPGPVNL
ncbi:unnamed protein product [Durusdinium trenchii]|uniref:CSD domain-containing protein n=1 Tax=Durusdinium trenchii TaxID=1381693 RepID=A0ABP0SSW3_9DINO